MALLLMTPDARKLWEAFSKAIDEDDVRTWEFHSDGVHFTHSSKQWNRQAWFKADILDGTLAFNIVKPTGKNISKEVYAEYHALLLRVFLARFDNHFSHAFTTALASVDDIVAERD